MTSSLPHLKKLQQTFYLRPTLTVARQLIGKYLVKKLRHELLVGRIVEVEAYLGKDDPASHSYNGKTQRNEVMFRAGGCLYVYFTYGMHFCSNVVTEREGVGCAVLLRAVEPVRGLETMARNRKISLRREGDVYNLCSGPAKLCEAFAITRADNGADLCGNKIWIAQTGEEVPRHHIATTTRVGITQGRQYRRRFFLKDNPFVSKGKPS